MNKIKISPTVQFALTFLWRLVLILATVAALISAGIYMTLQTVLCGPSEAARDQLVLTLQESPKTNRLPVHFLDKETIAAIQTVAYTFDSQCSDPALITVTPAASTTEQTLENINYTARVILGADPAGIPIAGEGNYAGFTADGKLLLATSPEEAAALGIGARCGHILILNGQANEGLFAAPSGFAPRMAVGQRADGTVILVTTDGWTRQHIGATYQDLINIMTHYGAVNACIITSEE